MSRYSKSTLDGNWFEDRASRLNGVLPLDDAKSVTTMYTTTTASEFAGRQTTQVNKQARLINADNTRLAQDEDLRYCDDAKSIPVNIRTPLSTYQESYGVSRSMNYDIGKSRDKCGPKVSEAALIAGHSKSGTVVEVSASAHLLRSSYRDPKNAYTENKPSRISAYRIARGSDGAPNHGKRLTCITGVPFGHQGVFVDD